jgi:hypothetical protein
MSRNGSGVYSLPAGNPVVTGTTISSTWANTTLSDISTALTGSVASDGQTAMTGNLQMGNNKVTGLAVATSSGDALSFGQAATISALTVTGAAALNGGITVDTNAFIVADTTGSITTAGSLTFTGTGNRITGDFSNATFSNRASFQTSTTNGNTGIQALPNGTATTSAFQAYNNSNPTNSSVVGLIASPTDVRLDSNIRGTGTYLPLTIHTSNLERMRISTDGNVGIGTTAAGQKLNVDGSLQLYGAANTRGIYWNMYGVNSDYIDVNGAADGNIMRFGTANTERMRIDGIGNVGIGLSSPAFKLNVYEGAGATISTGFRTNQTGSYISFRDATTASDTSCRIGVVGESILFLNSGATERMRISSTGNVSIGTSSANPTNGAAFVRDDSRGVYLILATTATGGWGQLNFVNGNGVVGSVATAGTTTTYNTSSDYRLKENIAPMTGALAKVSALNPVTYT